MRSRISVCQSENHTPTATVPMTAMTAVTSQTRGPGEDHRVSRESMYRSTQAAKTPRL